MMKLTINQSKQGEYERVTVECQVAKPKTLVTWQDKLNQVLPQLRLQDSHDLHVTICHFGKPQDLFIEVMSSGSEIDFTQFMEHFYEFLNNCQIICRSFKSNDISVTAHRLKFLRSRQQRVIVLDLGRPNILHQTRIQVAGQLKIFLNKCEVFDPVSFIQQSSNLRYALSKGDFHLTLARTKKEVKDLPKLTSKLVVRLIPPSLRNVSI